MRILKRLAAVCLVLTMLLTSMSFLALESKALVGAGAPSATNPEMILGIDLSYWNVGQNSLKYSMVNFEELKADGVKFVILRLGYETSTTSGIKVDPSFDELYKRARAAGLDIGLYLYSYALTYNAAKEDAQYVMNYIEARNMYFEYPIYLDMETTAQTSASASTMQNICLGWCEILEQNNYYGAVYSAYWVYNSLSSSFKSRYDFWVPAYKSNTYSDPQYTYNSTNSLLGGKPYANGYCMWQYSCCNYYNGNYVYKGVYNSSGGRNTSLDLNVCYKNYPAIMKANGYNNCAPDESASKTKLRQLIASSFEVNHNDYSVNALEMIRNAEYEATQLINNESSTDAQFDAAYNKLNNAINAKTVALSKGKSYTTTANMRDDAYADDGIRLTDGSKGMWDGGHLSDGASKGYYSGWKDQVEIVVDLGSTQSSNTYTVYLAAGTWGIHLPKKGLFNVQVLTSNSATSGFSAVGTSDDIIHTGGPNVVSDQDWTTFTITVNAASSKSARYVKFIITNEECNGFIWLDEVEVSLGGGSIAGGAYINGFNQKIGSGDCHMFNSSFGTITTSTANHAYTKNIIAQYNSTLDRYVVTSISEGIGTSTPDITLASDQILIACHCWEGEGITDPVAGSGENSNIISRAKVGDVIEFSGINVQWAFVTSGAHVTFHGATEVASGTTPSHTEGEWKTNDDGTETLHCAVCGDVLDTRETASAIRGDVNNDGYVDIFDYLIVKSIYNGTTMDNSTVARSDVNNDGAVDIFDYLIIKTLCF